MVEKITESAKAEHDCGERSLLVPIRGDGSIILHDGRELIVRARP